MNKILALVLLFLTSLTYAQENYEEGIENLEKTVKEHESAIDEIFSELELLKLDRIHEKLKTTALPAAIPGEEIIEHSAMTLSYNENHEQANWVAHMITKDILYGNVSRTNDFRLDPKVSTITADSVDYWDSGYDRGHLAPSADFRWSRKALSESYFYSNMSPQRPELNRESWAKLENQIREWALDASELIVITGPVLRDGLPTIPQGSERVSIPEYYYKIAFDYVEPEFKAIGFILPNKTAEYRLLDYAVSIDSIEQLTGIDFFAQIPDEIEAEVEAMDDIMVWPISTDATKGDIMPIDFAKGQIGAQQARYFIGDECTVCGLVVATKHFENGKTNPTYINLDKKFPDQVFTLVIFGKDRINFTYEPEKYLYGKRICIKGKVGEFGGTPQIIASTEDAIEVMK